MANKPALQQKQIMQMISVGASRRDLVRHFGSLTPEKVLLDGYPSLAKIRKDQGEERTENALAVLIADTSLAFGDDMQQDTALELATEVLNSYYYMSLEDCYLVLQRLKRSKLFGKFTLNKVLNAFETYNNERLNLAGEQSYNAHLSIKEAPKSPGKLADIVKQHKKKANLNEKRKYN